MKIHAEAEASRRRTLSEAEAYAIRRETSLAQFENLKREVELIERNPTWVNKTLAEKLGDKVQVIVMPNLTADLLAPERWASASRTASPRSLRARNDEEKNTPEQKRKEKETEIEREEKEREKGDFHESEEGRRSRLGGPHDACLGRSRRGRRVRRLPHRPVERAAAFSTF